MEWCKHLLVFAKQHWVFVKSWSWLRLNADVCLWRYVNCTLPVFTPHIDCFPSIHQSLLIANGQHSMNSWILLKITTLGGKSTLLQIVSVNRDYPCSWWDALTGTWVESRDKIISPKCKIHINIPSIGHFEMSLSFFQNQIYEKLNISMRTLLFYYQWVILLENHFKWYVTWEQISFTKH